MRRLMAIAVVCLVVGLVVGGRQDAGAQRRYYDSPRGLYTQQLIRRIDDLQRRVERLERQLPPNAREAKSVSVATAEQRVAAAKDRFEYATELFRKSYISKAQLEAERFEMKRAQKVLECSQASRDGLPIDDLAIEIAILDAEHDLAVAERQLSVTQRMVTQGFIDRAETAPHRLAVEAAQRRLEEARQKKKE